MSYQELNIVASDVSGDFSDATLRAIRELIAKQETEQAGEITTYAQYASACEAATMRAAVLKAVEEAQVPDEPSPQDKDGIAPAADVVAVSAEHVSDLDDHVAPAPLSDAHYAPNEPDAPQKRSLFELMFGK